MAEGFNVEIRKDDGSFASVKCPEKVLALLQDTSTDESVKAALHELLAIQVKECETPNTSEVKDGNKTAWNSLKEKVLLDQYKIVDPTQFPKTRWKTIAENLKVQGYNVTPEQCRLKIKGLKNRHERLKKTGARGLCSSLDDNVQAVTPSSCDSFAEIGQMLSLNFEACTSPPDPEESLFPATVGESSDIPMFDDVPKSTWDQDTEKMVLEQFKIVDSGKITKTKWKKIAKNINSHGYNFTPEQCRMKVKAFSKRDKRLSKKHVKAPTPDDNLRNIKDAFDSYPHIKPVFIMDSGCLSQMPSATSTSSDQNIQTENEQGNEEISDGPSTSKKRRKVSNSLNEVPSIDNLTNIEEMKEFLETLFVKKKAAMKKRNKEKMALWGSLINVLQDVAKKLKPNDDNGGTS